MDKNIENLMNEVQIREQIVECYQVYGAFDKKAVVEVIKNFENLNVPIVDEEFNKMPSNLELLESMPDGRLLSILINQANSIMMEIYDSTKNK